MSTRYDVEGWVSKEITGRTYPFPVKVGSRAIAPKYGVKGVPTIAVLVNGVFRQKIAGSRDIQDAPVIIRALAAGGSTVTESAQIKIGTDVAVTGWISAKGKYVKNARFALTDRKNTISVRPWLPLEAVRSPFKKTRPRLMSDVINKPVYLEGVVTKMNDELQFTVRKEIILE